MPCLLITHRAIIKSTETYKRLKKKKRKVPLHTLLAASAEVMPLKLPMLVVMVTMMLMMMLMMVKVGVVNTGRTAMLATGAAVDDVFRRAFVDHMWVVTFRRTVVVLLSKMLGHRGYQVFLVRHADKT